jgi:hypothetical protein
MADRSGSAGARAELLVDVRGPAPYRRLLLAAGTTGRAWPLYAGAERWMFDGGERRAEVPRADLKLHQADAEGADGR